MTHTAMRDRFTDEQLRDQAKTQQRTGHGPLSRHDMFLIDVADHLKWVEYAIYASQGGKPRKPEPTPRPGVPSKRTKTEVAPLNASGLAHLQHLREANRR